MKQYTQSQQISWLNFDNLAGQATVFGLIYGTNEAGKTFQVSDIKATIAGEKYLQMFMLPATITIGETQVSGTLGEIISYIVSSALRLEDAEWQLSADELAKFGSELGEQLLTGLETAPAQEEPADES
jgi:hypothetical protein